MHRITVDEWKHVPAGESVWNGFAVNGTCVAPSEPGFYTLYELVVGNTHLGWEWEKEDDGSGEGFLEWSDEE